MGMKDCTRAGTMLSRIRCQIRNADTYGIYNWSGIKDDLAAIDAIQGILGAP